MSTGIGAILVAVSLSGGVADEPAVPRPIIEAALAKAECTLPARQAVVVGTEHLSSGLQIVEVACWRTAYNTGSILFAVPKHRPEAAQLLSIESWHRGRVERSYSVASPGYDAKTRTISSTHKASRDGDCGTIQEMKWTGWHFRLLNVWNKTRCDGEPFEWDSRETWQVFPADGIVSDPKGKASSRAGAHSSRE